MINDPTFWGIPIHFDPFSFFVGLFSFFVSLFSFSIGFAAFIVGLLALWFIYKEYCFNHRHIIKILDLHSGEKQTLLNPAGMIFSKIIPYLYLKLQNKGLSIENPKVYLFIKNQFGERRIEISPIKDMNNILLLDRGSIAQYEIKDECSILDLLDTKELDNTKVGISICSGSGKNQIIEHNFSTRYLFSQWNNFALKVNKRFEKIITNTDGTRHMVVKFQLPIINTNYFETSVRDYINLRIPNKISPDFSSKKE